MDNTWISVEERLPEKGVAVLAYSRLWQGYEIAAIKEATDGVWDVWETQDQDWFSIGDFSHWMPLPDPPEVEK